MYPETMANDNPDLARNIAAAPLRDLALVVGRAGFSLDRSPWSWWFLLAGLCSRAAQADGKLRIAVQKTGTFSWELAVIKARGLDRKAGLDIEVTEFASPEAAKIALLGGAADIILTDWPWVARQRSLGGQLVFRSLFDRAWRGHGPGGIADHGSGWFERQENRRRGRPARQELALASGLCAPIAF